MSDTNTGGPAFPTDTATVEYGMTLRDYFAAKAMQADYSAVQMKGKCELYSDIAERAYIVADAMLKARQQ